MISELYLAWQDAHSRRWFVIGKLGRSSRGFTFEYLRGATDAESIAGFQVLMPFPRFDWLYESNDLFPFFKTRMMSASRPDYREYMEWLGLDLRDADPFEVLSRSEALHATDRFRVYSGPVNRVHGGQPYSIFRFPLHGLRHATPSSQERALSLRANESLLLMRDSQNPQDRQALAFRTSETEDQDLYLMGYCPRYYASELGRALDQPADISVYVERVNPEPAPWNIRVIVRAEVKGFAGAWMSSSEYESLAVPVSA